MAPQSKQGMQEKGDDAPILSALVISNQRLSFHELTIRTYIVRSVVSSLVSLAFFNGTKRLVEGEKKYGKYATVILSIIS